MCDSTQGSLCLNPMKIHQCMWIQWPFFKNFDQKVNNPRWHLTSLLLMSHVQFPKDHCVSPMKIHQCMWLQWPFFKKQPKGQWPQMTLDDLWSHFCWGHKCDSTQETLCPSSKQIIKVCGYSDHISKLWPRTDRWTTYRMSDHISLVHTGRV